VLATVVFAAGAAAAQPYPAANKITLIVAFAPGASPTRSRAWWRKA